MCSTSHPVLPALLAVCLAVAAPAVATDTDGSNDCQRTTTDYGDAPEGVDAYPGVLGRFPTCSGGAPLGAQESDCPPLSTPPGPAGFVVHANSILGQGYWLGCVPGIPPLGIDSEADGKTNASGAALSVCAAGITVDCFESAYGMTFGQDECAGSNDAGVLGPLTFTACIPATFDFRVFNCAAPRRAYLNVLVDWNEDGDWNDNLRCGSSAVCAYEWAVKNHELTLAGACQTYTTPSFLAGPRPGKGWLRISISSQPVPDDFPWNGSAGLAGQMLQGGETEDYPVEIEPCLPDYSDLGDAPEGIVAYPDGTIGHFPTCTAPGEPGTQETDCPALGTPPGPTGHVRHVASATDTRRFWLGCGPALDGVDAVDTDADGKVNLVPPGGGSACSPGVTPDCTESALTLTFGQDECYGDGDAAVIPIPVQLEACSGSQQGFWFRTYSCAPDTIKVWANLLMDWTMDGDWNDTVPPCPPLTCNQEWLFKNIETIIQPGCDSIGFLFATGPKTGIAWMRLSLSLDKMPDDYPWNGTLSLPGGAAHGGETEDYAVLICDPCPAGYEDFGDAPEEIEAYPGGPFAAYPTCILGTAPGTQEVECGVPPSTPPGTTGYVKHLDDPGDPYHYWLGCGHAQAPCLGHDDEHDGKVNLPGMGTTSHCQSNLTVDCFEPVFGALYGQDECFGDFDAGVAGDPGWVACTSGTVRFSAYSCSADPVSVYLNVLVDWRRDGDWNDVMSCPPAGECALEWAVKNRLVQLPPGCSQQVSPSFLVGPRVGPTWMRLSLTTDPVSDDFPWDGSAGAPNGAVRGGETEDYPVTIKSALDVRTRPPDELWLDQAPNPGRDRTAVRFGLPWSARVTLAVFDVSGRRVRALADGPREAGVHIVDWDFRDDVGRDVPAGLYLVKLEANGRALAQRISRVR